MNKKAQSICVLAILLSGHLWASDTDQKIKNIVTMYCSTVCGFLIYTAASAYDTNTFELYSAIEQKKFAEYRRQCLTQLSGNPTGNSSSETQLSTAIEMHITGMRVYPQRDTDRSINAFLIPIEKTIHASTRNALEQLVLTAIKRYEKNRGDDFWIAGLSKSYAWIPQPDNTRSLRIKAEIAPAFIKEAILHRNEIYSSTVQQVNTALAILEKGLI
jgi:hypothetical protein